MNKNVVIPESGAPSTEKSTIDQLTLVPYRSWRRHGHSIDPDEGKKEKK